jgi:hypothetical protein
MCSKSNISYRAFKAQYLVFALLFLNTLSANAQCAMCRAAIESEGNGQKAEAINDGIVYLMIIPYVLVGAIGYYIYRMNKRKKA